MPSPLAKGFPPYRQMMPHSATFTIYKARIEFNPLNVYTPVSILKAYPQQEVIAKLRRKHKKGFLIKFKSQSEHEYLHGIRNLLK